MIIKNARVLYGDRDPVLNDIYLDGERIAEKRPIGPDEEIVDAGGLYALPGLTDMHFHGAMGHDFCDADAQGLREILDFEAAHGVLTACPATMTFPEETLNGVMDVARDHRNETGAELVGINLEGPFISPARVGAQNPDYVTPADTAMYERLNARSGGLIRLVDIAPEVGENMDFIRKNAGRVRISLAHTDADYDTARTAFSLGAKQLTHGFNAMPGIVHRAPGPLLAAVESGAQTELITDGVHIHPAVIRMAFRLFGPENILMISDSMRACGLKDGEYDLGGQPVTVRGKLAVLSRDMTSIAGSVTCLYDCMREAVCHMGISLKDAVRAAAYNPAAALGIDRDYGSLTKGHYGNIILADDSLAIRAVYRKGKRIV